MYLIRGAIFRPNYATGRSGRSTLNICPLGELVDMYHTQEATKRHDKVFALLGMASDDPNQVIISPNYGAPWEDLLRQLTQSVLCENISVQTWANKEIVEIKSVGCVLGRVSSIQTDTTQEGRQGIDIQLKWETESCHWVIQASAKSVRVGDIICVLQGASRPTIIRECEDYFAVVLIAVSPPDTIRLWTGLFKWPEILQLKKLESHFTHDFLLVWDWKVALETSQQLRGYDMFTQRNGIVLGYSDEEILHKASRLWNVALVLGESREDKRADETIRNAIEGFLTAFAEGLSDSLKSKYNLTAPRWAEWKGYDVVLDLLLQKQGVKPNSTSTQERRTALSFAAGGGSEATVKFLLENGADTDYKDCADRTPLSWAAGNGHETIVKLLLEKGADVDSKDTTKKTPLHWASIGGYTAIVKFLLESGAYADYGDWDHRTPLSLAAGNGDETIVKLLLERGAKVDSRDNEGSTPIGRARGRGYTAIVEVLLENGAEG
jgi:ankyrin repeat protein